MDLNNPSRKIRLRRRKGFEPGFASDDDGRREAGYKNDAADCVVRATCIALGLDYETTLRSYRKIILERIRSDRPWESSLREGEPKGADADEPITRYERKMTRNGNVGIRVDIADGTLTDLGFAYVKTWRKGIFISNCSRAVEQAQERRSRVQHHFDISPSGGLLEHYRRC